MFFWDLKNNHQLYSHLMRSRNNFLATDAYAEGLLMSIVVILILANVSG